MSLRAKSQSLYFFFYYHFLSLCYVLGTKLSILYAFCMVSCSVNFSRSVMSDSLWPHGLQHARLPCPSPTPGACSNSCPSSRWCHPTISSSVVPFSCLQSFPASGSFPMSQFFVLGGQSIGVLVSASVHPMNTKDWFPLWLTGLISNGHVSPFNYSQAVGRRQQPPRIFWLPYSKAGYLGCKQLARHNSPKGNRNMIR